MTKRALITGITGQDGSYLAELLLDKGYEVIGMVRRSSTVNFERIAHIQDRITFVPGDLLDEVLDDQHARTSTGRTRCTTSPPSPSCRRRSGQPVLTGEITALGVTRMLDAVRLVDPDIRFYQASSSEMFGKVQEVPQTEDHPAVPPLPVRRGQGLRPLDHGELPGELRPARLLGHPVQPRSPRRGLEFVTRKISHTVAQIKLGHGGRAALGNLDAQRDWGFAGDYVEAMWLMLQQDEPDDYVVSTGETHPVREFCELAFGHVDLDWEQYVVQDERFMRPAEVDLLVGDPTKARKELGLEAQDLVPGAGHDDGRRRPRPPPRRSGADPLPLTPIDPR